MKVNAYSRRFAELILATHPEWRPLARVDPDGFPSPGSLLLEIPSPVAGRALMVRTYGDQITVDFGPPGWHEHFGSWSGSSEEVVFGVALGFIDDLLSDRVVVVTRILFGRPMWSRAMQATRVRQPLIGRAAIYSWSGGPDTKVSRA